MLQYYFALKHILQKMPPHKELRDFALKHKNLSKKQLLFTYLKKFSKNYSFKFIKWFYFLSFILGIIVSIGLLSYSGKEPVNLLYFLFVAIVLPLFSAFFTVIAFLTNTKAFFIGYFLEKIISSFTKEKITIKEKKIQKWFELKTLLFAQFLFGVGFLFGFLFKIAFSDIAFAWSSTLDISVNQLYNILHLLSTPWHGILNDYLSIELLKSSQFFHLQSIKQHLSPHTLALWWRYLFFATLFYMVFLRFILFAIALFFYHKSAKEAIFKNAAPLLKQFSTPYISTKEKAYQLNKTKNLHFSSTSILTPTKYAIAWNFNEDEVKLLKKHFPQTTLFALNAFISYDEESELLKQIPTKEITLFLKAWESPTKDFIDFITKLQSYFKKITIALIGYNLQKPNKKDVAIWQESLKNCSFLKFASV